MNVPDVGRDPTKAVVPLHVTERHWMTDTEAAAVVWEYLHRDSLIQQAVRQLKLGKMLKQRGIR